MKLRAIIPPTTPVPTARQIQACLFVSNSIRDAEQQLRGVFPRTLVHFDGEAVGVHEPAQDEASGPFGHLGVCLGRIVKC